MPVFALTTLVMLAFAANSLLNRAALLGGEMDPATFALIRVAAGAVTLLGMVALRNSLRVTRANWGAVSALTAYLLGFSFAYLTMDAGVGALILFGGVQVTMFAGAVYEGEPVPRRRWIGMFVSLLGLIMLLWPSGGLMISPLGFLLMSIAALGWGLYSLIGRGVSDPLSATAWNFTYAIPMVALGWGIAPGDVAVSHTGIWLAILSGAVTSGLGYALWYSVLPRLGASIGALAQLSVPVLAIGLGALLLGEGVAPKTLLAALLVLAGIWLGTKKNFRPHGKSQT